MKTENLYNRLADLHDALMAHPETYRVIMPVVEALADAVEELAAAECEGFVAKQEGAQKPRKTITEEELVAALNAHVVRCSITGRHPAAKGWKGAISYHLKMDPRTLRWPPGWDEARILDHLEAA